MARTKTVRTLVATAFAVAVVTSLNAETITWTGGTSGDWAGEGVWSPQAPAAGDDVVIDTASAVVTLSESTPVLNSLTIGLSSVSTLVASNGWQTCIQAGSVTVGAKGVLTCADNAGKQETNEMSRVWVKCTDLMVAVGGRIDVSSRGYCRDRVNKVAGTWGYGPGAGFGGESNRGGSSGSHGGYGAAFKCIWTLPYDDPEDPVYPGSSSGCSGWGVTAGTGSPVVAGGGVVRIEATGIVTVNGSILASGENSGKYNASAYFMYDNPAGAGGTINIICNVFKGQNGVLRADGGNSGNPDSDFEKTSNVNQSRVGGGGCIAVKYNVADQQDGFVSGMTISAAPGHYKWISSGKTIQLGTGDLDKYRSEADLGTLWFSDAKLLQSLGTGISGQIWNLKELSVDSFSLTAGHIRFAEDGFKLTVAGDLTVSGREARLEVGGTSATLRAGAPDLFSEIPSTVTVGGNFVVSDGGRFDIRAATNNVDGAGAKVSVAGLLSVGAGSSVCCWSDPVVGTSPRFDVGTFTVAEGGVVSADERGFRGAFYGVYNDGTSRRAAAGPGCGREYWTASAGGGGHGGKGGFWTTAKPSGIVYDNDPYFPCQPGSGGDALDGHALRGGSGGGVVDVRASGAIEINGRISADGGIGVSLVTYGKVGSGAGGTIFLSGKTCSFGEAAVISANGSRSYAGGQKPNNGAGGGGRIAIWTGAPYSPDVKVRRITHSESPIEAGGTYLATPPTVLGGVQAEGQGDNLAGTDGTVWFSHIADKPGLMLLLR